MTKKECKRDSKLQSHITFQYTLRYEMRGVVYTFSLVTFSTLLMLIGYFYEFYVQETPSLDKFRLRILIYLCYWLIGLLVFGLLSLIVHYIVHFIRIKCNLYEDRYLSFADYELNRMLDKGKITESELNRFFLNDAMISMGIDPFSKPYVLTKKQEIELGYDDRYDDYADYDNDYEEDYYNDQYYEEEDYDERPLSKKEIKRREKEEKKLSKLREKEAKKNNRKDGNRLSRRDKPSPSNSRQQGPIKRSRGKTQPRNYR